jgi:hypothetical protein
MGKKSQEDTENAEGTEKKCCAAPTVLANRILTIPSPYGLG